MKYFNVVNNIKFYYKNESDMQAALHNPNWDNCMQIAVAAVDLKNNNLIKTRYNFEFIFDNLEIENNSNELPNILLTICDNLNDMPISEDWAKTTVRNILNTVDGKSGLT